MQVVELSYDIEDHVDTFMVRVDAHIPNKLRGVKGLIDRSGNLMKKTSIRRKIGLAVKDIKSHITEVSQRRDRYKLDNITSKPVGTTIHSLRLSALYNDMTKLVGIEEKSDHLVKRLMKGHQASRGQLEIVSIVGFGGLGKTTLAKIVYDKIKDQFDCGAFVSISLNPNMEKIFKSMIHQIDMSEYSKINDATLDEVALIEKLREILEKRSYLVVIDDIWDKYLWEKIKYIFVGNVKANKIIITTRILDVAKQAGGYGIRGLVIDSSYPFRCLAWLEVVSSEMMRFAPGAMQKLRALSVPNPNACWPVCGVENLPSLEHISFSIRCKLEELDIVAAEFREFLDTGRSLCTFHSAEFWMKVCVWHGLQN
ncbi:hypothetical protein PR202_gb13213 [Eleusine coracana subsp. coracana]|uniref:NB-ARC domain-containing protein n=1 Tax=Eleusine coracana subsp. coracana TaxID=191504 RepID=A0AAV5ES39_ELECO|nr:hypothetical protein PR202_gb13213 [Eleusine coracana subsp. coracana]